MVFWQTFAFVSPNCVYANLAARSELAAFIDVFADPLGVGLEALLAVAGASGR